MVKQSAVQRARAKAAAEATEKLKEQQGRLDAESQVEQLKQQLAAARAKSPPARGTPAERVPASRPSGGRLSEEKSDDPEGSDRASSADSGEGGAGGDGNESDHSDGSAARDRYFGGGGRDEDGFEPTAAGQEQQRGWADEDDESGDSEEISPIFRPQDASPIVAMLQQHQRDGKGTNRIPRLAHVHRAPSLRRRQQEHRLPSLAVGRLG